MLVSVIIPTYNRAATIMRAVDSVRQQTHSHLEIIVVDDGSDDETVEILQRYEDTIQIIRQKNAGPSAARNAGIRVARGEVIAFLDSDDVWLPEKIERQVELFRKGGASMICCICNATFTDHSGVKKSSFEIAGINISKKTGLWTNPAEIFATRFVLFNQVVAIRRETLEKIGVFREDLWLLEDYEFALRLSTMGGWGILGESLVLKHNETDGIGVQAMRQQTRMQHAYVAVMDQFLRETQGFCPRARKLAETALKYARMEAVAGNWISSQRWTTATVGRGFLYFVRGICALRRRLPGWPRAQIKFVG